MSPQGRDFLEDVPSPNARRGQDNYGDPAYGYPQGHDRSPSDVPQSAGEQSTPWEWEQGQGHDRPPQDVPQSAGGQSTPWEWE